MKNMQDNLIRFLALFGSTGTLLCCALPAALAAIAGGAAISAYVSAFPSVIPLSRHKGWMFLIAGALIAFNGFLTFRPQGRLACAMTGGNGCKVAGTFSKFMFWIAATIYMAGAFMSYGIVPLLELMEE